MICVKVIRADELLTPYSYSTWGREAGLSGTWLREVGGSRWRRQVTVTGKIMRRWWKRI